MSKTLAELRKEKDQPASLPTIIVRVCLDQGLSAEIQRLTNEKADLQNRAVMSSGDEPDSDATDAPPRRMSQGPSPRIAEIDAELEPLYERLREAEGELLIRAGDGGAWLRWKDAHPAREDNDLDMRLAYGYCNATDLANDLGKYVVSWDGDDFGPGEWDDWFCARVSPADLGEIVRAVVMVHEQRMQAPKSQSSSSEHPTSDDDSTSPAP